MQDILLKVEELNKKATLLNNQRNQKIGAKEEAEKEFQRQSEELKQVYGLEVTPENIGGIYEIECEKLKSEVASLEKQITDIESGNFVPEFSTPLPEVSATPETVHVTATGTGVIEKVEEANIPQFVAPDVSMVATVAPVATPVTAPVATPTQGFGVLPTPAEVANTPVTPEKEENAVVLGTGNNTLGAFGVGVNSNEGVIQEQASSDLNVHFNTLLGNGN